MDGGGLVTTVPLIIHVLDINDETPVFQDMPIQFVLNQDMRNFTERAFIKVNGFYISYEIDHNINIYIMVSGNWTTINIFSKRYTVIGSVKF